MKFYRKLLLFFVLILFQSISQNIFCMSDFDGGGDSFKSSSDDGEDSFKKGTIFMLVGTSSSGKTSILNRLKELEETDKKLYTELYIFEPDQISDRKLNKYKADCDFEEDVLKLSPASSQKFYHESSSSSSSSSADRLELEHKRAIDVAKNMADKGKSVIFETVLLNKADQPDDLYDLMKKEFEEYDLCMILVYCPIDIIYSNIVEKNKKAQLYKSPKDSRNAFLALKQFPSVYSKASTKDSEDIVDKIYMEEVLQLCSKIAPQGEIANCFLVNLFQAKFGLSQDTSPVFIKSTHKYDFIVKNETQNKLEIDDLLVFIKKKLELDFKKDEKKN